MSESYNIARVVTEQAGQVGKSFMDYGPFYAAGLLWIVAILLYRFHKRESDGRMKKVLLLLFVMAILSAFGMTGYCAVYWKELTASQYSRSIVIEGVDGSSLTQALNVYIQKKITSEGKNRSFRYRLEILELRHEDFNEYDSVTLSITTPQYYEFVIPYNKDRHFVLSSDIATGCPYLKGEKSTIYPGECGSKSLDSKPHTGLYRNKELSFDVVPAKLTIAQENADYLRGNFTLVKSDPEFDVSKAVQTLQSPSASPVDKVNELARIVKLDKAQINEVLSTLVPGNEFMLITVYDYTRSANNYISTLAKGILEKSDWMQVMNSFLMDPQNTSGHKDALISRLGKDVAEKFYKKFGLPIVGNALSSKSFTFLELIPTMTDASEIYLVAFDNPVDKNRLQRLAECYKGNPPNEVSQRNLGASSQSVVRSFSVKTMALQYYFCCVLNNIPAYFTGY